ncbi:Scr1 family TA system antitoxin-like transcriptional regulator [Actinomadura sp. NPDC000600]|uniref:helix-turn-helix domain-containing protein n=2 Tax=unclassified Actinomadura TaxID=2626254 RepID=UPI00339B5D31
MSVRESIDPASSLWAWLAFDLWFYRTQRGLSLAQTAMIVHVTRATVSNWEAGRLRPRDTYMKRLDQAWNTGGHFERLHMFACGGHDPDWFKQYLQYEEAADVIKMYHGKTVPALAQTKAYAQALLKAAGRADEAEAEAQARMKRQEILLRKEPPYLWILIDQEVLDNVVGGCEVMAEQLHHLIELGDTDRVCVRVVPRASGWHPGHDGHFQVMTINGRGVSYAVAQVAGRLIEAGDESALLEVRFDQIGALALPRTDSQALMDRMLRKYE